MTSVDLNADMGESFGPWNMGDDASLLKTITSANIACGFHAGDPDVMAKTMTLAAENGVGIGAHPGFPDLQGFGRRNMKVPHDTLRNMVRYQLGAAQGMADALGITVRHLKLHGALANMCSVDADMARACYQGALDVDPDIIIMVLAATKQEATVRDLGCKWVGEIFADRAYNDDGTLVDRSLPGAVIHDPAIAGPRILEMVRAGAIITESGKHIETSIDTICLHGDTPTAVQLAKSVRDSLTTGGISVTKFEL
ncbi:LamB/YcsF family protein [Phaeobacter gallaeciensis]|uniref:5-oxoprolinase subunit A n=2 Tax=Roseobacteraceae TaxID=2854170 RepID=A0A366WQB5_9RHOB|nr:MULTISPECIES: 5-oxoprolinase subunit PxpA [Roseobacteraceae]MBT3141392.1 LamB/YcsF family protein [Falsiruegeria litorea]MBT8167466.1 LamB/YcsF family protein [Falsiruegeria litorea]RBW51031.1 LamB/YcsF family protein [Phaeobacter gallaeciensis]